VDAFHFTFRNENDLLMAMGLGDATSEGEAQSLW